jgi:2'-5' RNA ligase
MLPGMLVDDPREEYGREDEPHVTVLYGLLDEADMFKIRRYLSGVDPFFIELGEVSLFSNKPEYDVVKVDILSDPLQDVHKWIRENCKNSLTYPDYHPHMTLAYTKKSWAFEAFENPFEGKMIKVHSMEFSSANAGGKVEMPLKVRR